MENLQKLFTVAIVGRPNVGKSTLFNRLCGKKLAIVDNISGVTRDRKEAKAQIGDFIFKVIDTAGLEEVFDESLESRMRKQTEIALHEADCILFVIDAKVGLALLDYQFAKMLRSLDKSIVLLANKAEGKNSYDGFYESFRLGLGEPIPISAEHNDGMIDLYHALQPYYDKYQEENSLNIDLNNNQLQGESSNNRDEEPVIYDNDAILTTKEILQDLPLKLAIVGRPNAGKSTLINSIIDDNRLITGAEAGITRDSISIDWKYDDVNIKLIDTAGLRKKSKVWGRLERMSVADTNKAIIFAQVVVLLIDGNLMLEKQDLLIAQKIIDEGRAFIIVINKWDEVENTQKKLDEFKYKISTSLNQVKHIPVLTISAKTKKNIHKIIINAFKVFEQWNRRIPTNKLNNWLRYIQENHPAPLVNGRRIKIKYITQYKIRPPTFALFVNKPENLPESYIRYIRNEIRKQYKIEATPLRFIIKNNNNPYNI